jgi:signal transduction histidine kinase
MKLDEPRHFDRELVLQDLLAASPRERIAEGLRALFGDRWCVVDADDRALLGAAPAIAETRATLVHEGEPIGALIAAGNQPQVDGAARLVQAALASAVRYRMAVQVHEAAVAEDYAELQRKHEALMQSEARYRKLSEALEERVREQVREIEATQRRLYQAEKMASVGQLAAGVAHEINNPIGFVRSNLATAQRYLDQIALLIAAWRSADQAGADALWRRVDGAFLLEDFATLLAESIAGSERVARIVADLKTFSTIDQPPGESAIDVNECVRATLSVAAPLAPELATLAFDPSPLPPLTCHPGLFNEALLNLVKNAFAAVGEGGCVQVSTHAVGGAGGGEIRVCVRDDGCGIEPAVLPRIFDPFFTTRGVGQGTGLGLTVSRDIVAAYGGTIDVESTPGCGSTFTIRLPVASKSS